MSYNWDDMDDMQKDLKNCQKPKKSQLDSLAMYRTIFENSLDAIGVSKVGIHLFVNNAYLDLFGFPRGPIWLANQSWT